MIEFQDNFGINRAIDFNLSFCGKFINMTLYAPSKGSYGNALQIPMWAFNKLIVDLSELKEGIKHDKEI